VTPNQQTNIHFFHGNGNENHELGTVFFVHKRIVTAVKRVESYTYIILRGPWCDTIVLNVHAPTEDKIHDVNGRFYKELDQVFDEFPKYHTNIFSRFYAKVAVA
jgi:hypothetical protein